MLLIRNYEPDPWEEFPIVPLDLGDHSAFFVPSLCVAPEINKADLNPTLGRPPHGTGQIRIDESKLLLALKPQ